MTDTNHYESKLRELKAELEARLERIRDHEAEGVPSDLQEQVTARENDDVIQSLKVHIEEELQLISGALKRVDGGRYGSCAKCGNDIETGRLDLMPYTPWCSACA